MVSDQQRREWDSIAADLGPTVEYDELGRAKPFGNPDNPSLPENKRKYYVVWVGRARGIFQDWGLTNDLVCGYSGCAHRFFVGLETARAAWENGPPGKNQNWTPPGKPRPARSTSSQSPLPPTEESDDEDDSSPDRYPDISSCTPRAEVPIRPEDDEQLGLEARPSTCWIVVFLRRTRIHAFNPAVDVIWDTQPSNRPHPDLIPAITSLALEERLSEMHGGSSSSEMRACTSTPDPADPLNPGTNPSGAKFRFDTERAAARSEGDPVFVLVRGEHPGVYFDKDTALLAAGCIPGAKIVAFTSLTTACVHFVQKYMAGNVGGAGLRADG